MAVSLTCVCGAILEIDDKFKGQKIPCPDCNRLLDTSPAAAPPQTTSGWALASLVCSLGGMLTIVGPIAGIACGVLGLRQIGRDAKVGGVNFARAGIGLGALFVLISWWAFRGSEFLGLDAFLRLVSQSRDLRFPTELVVHSHKLGDGEFIISLKRPSLTWGVKTPTNTDTPDDLFLISPWEDAQILVYKIDYDLENKPNAEDYRREAINAFLKSGLSKMLTAGGEAPAFPMPEKVKVVSEKEKSPYPQSFTVEMAFGSTIREFLFHISELHMAQRQPRLNVAVGGTRKNRFEDMEESLAKSLESCKMEKQN